MKPMFKSLILVAFLAILGVGGTGCVGGIRVEMSGPYVGSNQDVVVINNNVKYDGDLFRNGMMLQKEPLLQGGTARAFFGGEDTVHITFKAYVKDSAGNKTYIGITDNIFYRYGRVQSWKIDYIDRPRGDDFLVQ